MRSKVAAAQAAVIAAARAFVAKRSSWYPDGDEFAALVDTLRDLDTAPLPDPGAGHGRWVEGAPETSRQAALVAPKGCRYDVLMQVAAATPGLTDEQLEHRLKRKHQTVSAARAHLVGVGWLEDSGLRNIVDPKRPKVIWRLTAAGARKLQEATDGAA